MDGLAYFEAVRATQLLGRAATSVEPGRRHEADKTLVRDLGFDLAQRWPRSVLRLLDKQVEHAIDGQAGLINTYGSLYTEFYEQSAGDTFTKRLVSVIEEHAIKHGVIAKNEVRRGRGASTMSATAVSRQLGRSFATTKRLLSEIGAVPTGSRRGVAFAIDVSTPARLPVRSSETVQDVLGVGKKQAARLVKIFSLVNAAGEPCPEAARVWLANFPKGIRTPGASVRLPVLCRNWAIPLETLCSAILVGQLACYRTSLEEGLAGFLVSPEASQLKKRAVQWTVEAVSRRFSVHAEALRDLLRAGALHRCNLQLIEDEVESFFSEFMTSAQLGRDLHTPTSLVAGLAAKHGVLPAFGPPSVRQTFFRRSVGARLVEMHVATKA